MRITHLVSAALLLTASFANADPVANSTVGKIYMVTTSGGTPFSAYSGGGYGSDPSQSIQITTFAQFVGGTVPGEMIFQQFNNIPFSGNVGSEYFLFGTMPNGDFIDFGLSSPAQGASQPLPDAWEIAIKGGLQNMDWLDSSLGAGGSVVFTTAGTLWNHLADFQEFETEGGLFNRHGYAGEGTSFFSDFDFAELTDLRAQYGGNTSGTSFVKHDPINELTFGTNEDFFDAFTPGDPAGRFATHYINVGWGGSTSDVAYAFTTQTPGGPILILNPTGDMYPGFNFPGNYRTQLQLTAPEPATWLLLGTPLVFGFARRRRRRRRAA